MEVAVLGGGHGCYAAAADIAEAGHSVRFWRRNTLAFAPVLDTQSITLTDTRGRRTIPLTLATENIAEAIDGAQLILSPIPGFASLPTFLETKNVSFRHPKNKLKKIDIQKTK